MRGERLLHTIRLWMIRESGKRAEYLRKHDIFAAMGEHCSIMNRKVPLYPKLIRFGSNVHLASNVGLITHDIAHVMLNGSGLLEKYRGGIINEYLGCIDIGDNVFIGAGTRVLGGVRIGSNVIVGAGSLVNKDVPDDSVAAGVPARVICSMEDFIGKRMPEVDYPAELKPRGQNVSKELAAWCWERFEKKREP